MKTEIIKIENGRVECPVVNEQRYVAIKPVCEILGIDPDGQRQAIQAHPLYNSVAELNPATGSDGKQYQMLCLPLKRFFLWLGGIHPNKVKEEARENVLKYQTLICDVLYEKFVEEPEFHKMKSEQKEKLRQQLDVVDESREKLRKRLKSVDNLTWEDFKANKQQLKLLFQE